MLPLLDVVAPPIVMVALLLVEDLLGVVVVGCLDAFHVQCNVANDSPDWYVDSGASAYMTSSSAYMDSASTYSGNDRVSFGNGNGTHHRLSCPYSPQQNGRAERKQRYITETNLAMMFNAHVPASMWTHAFDLLLILLTALHQALFAAKEPKGFKSAAKHPKWFIAMCDEMTDLCQNATWDLVPRPKHSNIVGSKWVFHIKFHVDGTIDWFKARFVAQGFT
nr:retrovirus-related Pol polyprotein from transposon TNT 1-94 [Tanacetum cinerariifolium]